MTETNERDWAGTEPDTSPKRADSAPSLSRHPRSEWIRNRREAAHRLPPLGECSCVRDPDRDRHRCRGGTTLRRADALILAADHLERHCLPPLFDPENLRDAWTLLPEHRSRIERLAALVAVA